MNAFNFVDIIESVARELLGEPNKSLSSKSEWRYGTKGSLKIDLTKATFSDFENNYGGGTLALIQREGHDDPIGWLRSKGYALPDRTVLATFDYTDEQGALLFQVCRVVGSKPFFQRRPNGHDEWISGIKDVRRVLYRLPKLISSTGTVYIPEGEKHVNALHRLDLNATCNAMGAGKWRTDYNEFLRDRDVVVLPDNDEPGHNHGQTIASNLQGVARSLRVLLLPNLKPKGDIINWLEAGGTKEQLEKLAAETPEWKPEPKIATPKAGTRSQTKSRGKQSSAQVLLDIATNNAELFHTPDGVTFADISVKGRRETWPLRSRTFRHWLGRCYYERTGGAPNSEARASALNVIEARAVYDGVERTISTRVGGHKGKIYLDLGDDTWRAIEIDADGWRPVDKPPLRFFRAAGMGRLPLPVRNDKVKASKLKEVLNLTDSDFTLAIAWQLAALRDIGPYPIGVLIGEPGAAKSTISNFLRTTIDPNTAPLRTLPRDERDLFIAASNSHALVYDNISSIPVWMADALCRLATGGGLGTRELHTDREEIIFDAVRPVLLNGIADVVNRPDLADRALLLNPEPISDKHRRTEKEIWSEFGAMHPAILGALLDGVAHGLKTLPITTLERLPRMADFAQWLHA